MQSISSVKGEYLRELLNKGIREEFRGLYDFRPIRIAQGVIPHAEGSAQVDLGYTKILVGVKLDIGEPMQDKPNEGVLMTSAELLPLASADYESGPPSPESIELARVVDRGIRAANVIDLESLFIEKEKVWNLFVDIYVLNYDGNLFDASMLAAVSSLTNTRMPREENDEVIREGKLGKVKVNNTVTSCTYAKIGGKIILDPSSAEESIMDARVTIANDEECIRAMQKGLSGAFSYDEIDGLIDRSFEKSKELRALIAKTQVD
jgi:exosome complex component RRP42